MWNKLERPSLVFHNTVIRALNIPLRRRYATVAPAQANINILGVSQRSRPLDPGSVVPSPEESPLASQHSRNWPSARVGRGSESGRFHLSSFALKSAARLGERH